MVYANLKTKKYHSGERGDQCRQGEILPKNLKTFPDSESAEKAGMVACKACYSEENET